MVPLSAVRSSWNRFRRCSKPDSSVQRESESVARTGQTTARTLRTTREKCTVDWKVWWSCFFFSSCSSTFLLFRSHSPVSFLRPPPFLYAVLSGELSPKMEMEKEGDIRGEVLGMCPREDRGSLIIRVVWNSHISDVIVIVLWDFFQAAPTPTSIQRRSLGTNRFKKRVNFEFLFKFFKGNFWIIWRKKKHVKCVKIVSDFFNQHVINTASAGVE